MDKRIIIGAAILAVLALGVGGFFLFSPSEDPDSRLRENTLQLARDYAAQGEFARALDLIDQLLIQDGMDEEARNLRDEIIQNRKEQSDEELAESRKQQSDLVDTLSEIGANIEETARKAGSPTIVVDASTFPQSGGQSETAREEAAEEARRAEAARAEEIREQQAEQERRAEAARQEAEAERQREEERSAEIRERNRKVKDYIEAGKTALAEERFDDARDNFNQAKGLDPEAAEAYAYLGETFYQEDGENTRNVSLAIENANLALEKNRNLWIPHHTLGKIYVDQADYEQALVEFKEASRMNPENTEILYELGKIQYRTRDYSAAANSFSRVLNLNGSHENAAFNLGVCYLRLGQKENALAAFSLAVQINPDYDKAHFQVAEIYKDMNNIDDAISSYHSAYAANSTSYLYAGALGYAYYQSGQLQKAEEYFTVSLSLNSNNGVTLHNMARVKYDLGKYTDALTYAAKAVQAESDSPSYFYTLGQACEANSLTDQAKQAYLNAIRLDNRYVLPMINLGKILDEQGEYDNALELLLQAYRLDSASLAVNNNLGNVYLHKELYNKSIEHYLKAIEKKPNATLMRYHLAIAYIETEQNELAVVVLRELLKVDSNYLDGYYRLGSLLFAQGEQEEAKTLFRTLLEKDPNYEQKEEILKYLE